MYRATLLAAFAMTLTGPASAQNWLDDFEDGSVSDGSPVSWVASPAFAAQFSVWNGDLLVRVPSGAAPAISSPRVAVNFPDGASVRARMTAYTGPGRYTVAYADEPTGIQGYVASFSTQDGGTIELFRGDVLGEIHHLGDSPLPWPSGPTEEFYVQLDVFDGIVSARIWRPGEPFPAPQISAPDSTYGSGVASIAIQDFGGVTFSDTLAVVRFAQASATPLTHSGIGDANVDGVVDVDDLIEIISGWGPCPETCPADVNGDGAVDVDDLVAVISNWSE